jgi:heme A synthase
VGTLRRLSLSAVVVAFGAVMLGSWTRINAAGMTCPDYPLCNGRLIPPLDGAALWEWMHRLSALLLAIAVGAVLVAAWRHRKSPFIAPAMFAVTGLVVLQIVLGAVTVHFANAPISVVLHWGVGMALVAALVALAVFAGLADAGSPETNRAAHAPGLLAGLLAGTTLIAFVTMCVGAYVSSSGAGLACLTIPGCAGSIVVYTPDQFVQMVHRFAALATLLCAVAACALAWIYAASPRVRAAASTGLVLVFVQIILGLLTVAWRLPMDLREAHAANAALVFLAFVCATIFALLDLRQIARAAAGAL